MMCVSLHVHRHHKLQPTNRSYISCSTVLELRKFIEFSSLDMPIEDVEKIVRKEPIENYYDVGNELGR